MRSTKIISGTVIFSVAFCLTAVSYAAGTMNARDFVAAPPGTPLSVLYYENEKANDFAGAPSGGRERLGVNALLYRQLWFTDICGTLCTPQFILPYADVDLRMPGATEESSSSGFGDPLVGGALYFANNPSERYYSGILTLFSIPIGKYDAMKPDSSPGYNRWEAWLTYNNTIGISDNWVLEANLEAEIYGDNDDYFGSTLEQSPLFSAQVIASYDFSSSSYGALSLRHSYGGEIEIDGSTVPSTTSRETRAGAEMGLWISNKDQVMISYSKSLDSKNSFESEKVLLRLSRAW